MKAATYPTIAKTTKFISVALYLISLTQQGFCTTSSCGDNWDGYALVGLGAIGGILSIAGLTWYANPLLWAGWSFIKKDASKAFMFSFAALVVGLSFLLFDEIGDRKPGVTSHITGYQTGYWLWVGSMFCAVIGSLLLCLEKKVPDTADANIFY